MLLTAAATGAGRAPRRSRRGRPRRRAAAAACRCGPGELAAAVELATSRAAGFVHRDRHDLVPGARADMVLLDAENVQDALVRAPARRLVIAAGRVVVADGELVI